MGNIFTTRQKHCHSQAESSRKRSCFDIAFLKLLKFNFTKVKLLINHIMQLRIADMSLILQKTQIHQLALLALILWMLVMSATCNILPSKKCMISSQWIIHSKRGGTAEYCRDCPDCPSGFELYPPCGKNISADTETGCQPCIKGITFSDTKDSASCKPCNICGKNKYVIQQCTLDQNRKCGGCLKGFYPTISGECLPCQSCCNSTEEEDKHEKCIKDGEKHCIKSVKCELPITEAPTNSSNVTPGNNETFISEEKTKPNKSIVWHIVVGVVGSIILIVVGVVFIYKCNDRKPLYRCSAYDSKISCTPYPVEEKQKISDDASRSLPEMQHLCVKPPDVENGGISDSGKPLSPETAAPIEESHEKTTEVPLLADARCLCEEM